LATRSCCTARPADGRSADGSARLDLAVTSDLANPHGNLHGGITLFACDLVAQAALAAVAGPPHTTSIHFAYPRPIPAGTTVRCEGRIRTETAPLRSPRSPP
jgi:acyl-coenzyme A thioesterase PaaI-like protein